MDVFGRKRKRIIWEASHLSVHKIWEAFWRSISHTVAGIVWASGSMYSD
jgi:hypothetical protein